MSFIVRPAEWMTDGDALLKLLQENLSGSIDRRRFDWLYRECPGGEAVVWLAVQEGDGRLVGAAAAFPRRMNIAGQIKTGCVLGDFCISRDYRSLGPALQLQRKCLEAVMNGPFSAGYDLPSTSMLAIYRRLGIKTEGRLVRMTKLLRSNAKIAARVRSRLLARGLSTVANAVLSARTSSKLKSGATIESHDGRFGPEFTNLAARGANRLGMSVERSADYLNWRYLDHPQHKYEILTARRGARLQGYLVFLQQGTAANVVDCFAETAEVRGDLIRGVVNLQQTRKGESVNMAVLESHSLCAELRDLGFRSRESVPAVFLEPKRTSSAAAGTEWYLLDGDRES